MSATYGDDLEVNYALSDEEDASEDSGPEGELVAEPALRLFAREPAAAAPAKAAGKGKKRTAWDEEEAGIDAAAEERRAKKRQRLDKLKEKAKSERAAARGKRPAGPPVGGSSAEQREFLWEFVLRQVGSELSSLERDAKPPESFFVDLAATGRPDSSVDLIKHALPNWSMLLSQRNKAQSAGSPHVLIVCASATRCTEILKEVAVFRCRAAKLFAKHIKVEEQQKVLQQITPIAVGTPARISKLLQLSALSLAHTGLVVLDGTGDTKQMTLFNMHMVSADMAELYRRHLHPLATGGKTRLCLW